MDRFAAMRSFDQVVDKEGVAPAARGLGLSAPMVGNHIRYLEAQLGGLLLNRTTRAQSLTELGRAYLARCRSILAEVEAAEADAAEVLGEPRGRLRVTAPHAYGATVLPPVIARFLRRYPGIDIELFLDNRRLNMLPDGFDAAIRAGCLEDNTLVTRALAPMDLMVCAAPDYLARCGEPLTLTELATHNCLDFAVSSTPGTWCFETADGTMEVAIAGSFRSNDGLALCSAAREGLGIVMLPKTLLQGDIGAGRLVALLSAYTPQSRPMQLLTLPGRQPLPKLRCFIDALVRDLGPVSFNRTT
jgi:DNA-binding transcriptional LysR family regulator